MAAMLNNESTGIQRRIYASYMRNPCQGLAMDKSFRDCLININEDCLR